PHPFGRRTTANCGGESAGAKASLADLRRTGREPRRRECPQRPGHDRRCPPFRGDGSACNSRLGGRTAGRTCCEAGPRKARRCCWPTWFVTFFTPIGTYPDARSCRLSALLCE